MTKAFLVVLLLGGVRCCVQSDGYHGHHPPTPRH